MSSARQHREHITFVWTNYSSYVYRAKLSNSLVLLGFGLSGVVLGFAMGSVLIAALAVSIALLPVGTAVPQRRRLEVTGDAVVVRQQPLHRNGLFWLSATCVGMSATSLALIATGEGAGRLVVSAVAGAIVLPVLGVAGYRYRGPLTVSSSGITFGNGARHAFGDATIVFRVLSNGVPAVIFTTIHQGVQQESRLLARPYHLDFNCLMSTIEQLQAWHNDGFYTAPAEIAAMLTVSAPDGVETGHNIQITVPVPAS